MNRANLPFFVLAIMGGFLLLIVVMLGPVGGRCRPTQLLPAENAPAISPLHPPYPDYPRRLHQADRLAEADDPMPPPDWLEFVPEMKPISGLPTGAAPDPKAAGRQVEKAQASLAKKLPEVEKLVTPDRVRSLSGWAKKQMESYAQVPPVTKATWTPVASDDKSGTILLEGTIDTLPTHSAVVVRWLKAYLVLDTNQNEITRVVVTIRGERHE